MVSFLSTAYAFNIETETCQRIIEKAVNFIQKQHRKSPYKGLFPNMIGDLIEPMQFSLCYGDLGTGYALLTAAIQLNDPSMRALADGVLEDCLTRTKEDNLTLDASLFYGASGLVVAFDKVAKLTNDKRYEERRDYWYKQIATYNVHRNDFAGFQSRLDSENELWNVGMGWGILGIGITLMAYSTEKLPAIDQLTFIA